MKHHKLEVLVELCEDLLVRMHMQGHRCILYLYLCGFVNESLGGFCLL